MKLGQMVRLAVTEHKERLTYPQVFQLSVLIGEPLAYSLTQPALARVAALYAPQEQEGRPPPAKVLKGLEEIGEGRLSAAQRMEKPV